MLDPQMLVKTHINQPVVGPPGVGIDDAVEGDFSANDGLQSGFGGIGNDLGVNFAFSFQEAKNNGFTACTPSPLTAYSPGAKVTLINLNGPVEGRLILTKSGHFLPGQVKNAVDGVAVQAGDLGGLQGRQVQGQAAQEAAKFSFGDAGIFKVLIFRLFVAHHQGLKATL